MRKNWLSYSSMNIHQKLLKTLITLIIIFGINQPLQAQKDVPSSKEPNYWVNKGDLCAVYGNDKAAIQYYKKALALIPNNSRTLFHLGISYGEIGDYEQALAFINKALTVDSQNGLYYYGRGRVFQLFGEMQKAIDDLKQAAVLGDRDARSYLKIKKGKMLYEN